MKKRNSLIFLSAVCLATMVVLPVRGEDPVPVKTPEPDLWASVDSTVKELLDPFIPRIPRRIQIPVQPSGTLEVPPESVQPTQQDSFLPNPMIPLPTEGQGPALPVFKLSGIIYNTDDPMAIVDGQVFAIGEVLLTEPVSGEEVTLVAVTAESIDVDFMDKKHTILLGE